MSPQIDESVFNRVASVAVQLGLQLLATRILTFTALGFAAGLFITAIVQGTLIALGVAGAYTALVFLPVLAKDSQPKAQ